MRPHLLWICASLGACTDRVPVKIPVPDLPGAKSEVVLIGDRVLAYDLGQDVVFEDQPLPDEDTVRIAARVFTRSLSELGLAPGPVAMAPGFRRGGTGFTLDITRGVPERWVPGEDPRLDGYAPAYRMKALGRGTGEVHTCFVSDAGQLDCAGALVQSPLGHASSTPAPMPGIDEVDQVASGNAHTCFIRRGHVQCFGDNTFGQLGRTASSTGSAIPLEVAAITDAIELEAHGNRTCALERGGRVTCWGTLYQTVRTTALPRALAFADPVEHLVVGTYAVCGVTGDAIACQSFHGPNGFPSSDGDGAVFEEVPIPLDLGALPSVKEITLATAGGCVLSARGEVDCWGYNGAGDVGTAERSDADLPPTRLAVPPLVDIDQGASNACGLTPDGRVFCWGVNNFGQLGLAGAASAPVALIGPDGDAISGAVEVAVYWSHICVRLATEEVLCGGRNDRGQLGASGPGSGLISVAF